MEKLIFDATFRPDIETGNLIVWGGNTNGTPEEMVILKWDGPNVHFPIIAMSSKTGIAYNYSDCGVPENVLERCVLTMTPSLTEFEYKLQDFADMVLDNYRSDSKMVRSTLDSWTRALYEIAEKEILDKLQDQIKTAYEQGKEDALKEAHNEWMNMKGQMIKSEEKSYWEGYDQGKKDGIAEQIENLKAIKKTLDGLD